MLDGIKNNHWLTIRELLKSTFPAYRTGSFWQVGTFAMEPKDAGFELQLMEWPPIVGVKFLVHGFLKY